MKHAFGIEIPITLEDVCQQGRLALLVYDMQVGILRQIENADQITSRVVEVVQAARAAGIRVLFCRHMSLPRELMGAFQLRMAMAWQRGRFGGANSAVVFARLACVSAHSTAEAASYRSSIRQDYNVSI